MPQSQPLFKSVNCFAVAVATVASQRPDQEWRQVEAEAKTKSQTAR